MEAYITIAATYQTQNDNFLQKGYINMPNFSNNYNKETQKKCIDCGIVYNLAPEQMKAVLIVKR